MSWFSSVENWWGRAKIPYHQKSACISIVSQDWVFSKEHSSSFFPFFKIRWGSWWEPRLFFCGLRPSNSKLLKDNACLYFRNSHGKMESKRLSTIPKSMHCLMAMSKRKSNLLYYYYIKQTCHRWRRKDKLTNRKYHHQQSTSLTWFRQEKERKNHQPHNLHP